MRVGGCSRNCVLTRGSAPRPRTLHPILKGEHQVLGSEATKAMEVAREASQKAQLASETAGRSAATAKGANTRTTALRDDVSHINKRLDEHEAATRADGEALRGRIQALEEANAAGGSHSPPSDAAAEVRAAKVTIEATKRDVAAMSADVKAAVAAGELLRGTKAILEGLQVEVRSARSGGAQHTKDIIEITETVRNVTETATLALQGAEEATAAIDKIKRDADATRETAIANNKSIDTTRRDVEAAWSDITGLRDDVKKIEAAAEVSNQTLQRLRRDTDANVKTANSDAKAASQRAATAQGAADEARTDAAALRRECRQPRPRSRPTPRQSRRPNGKRPTHGSKPPQRGTPSSSSSSGSPPSNRRTSGGTTRCNGRQTQPKQRNRPRPRGLGLSFRQFIAPRRIGKP